MNVKLKMENGKWLIFIFVLFIVLMANATPLPATAKACASLMTDANGPCRSTACVNVVEACPNPETQSLFDDAAACNEVRQCGAAAPAPGTTTAPGASVTTPSSRVELPNPLGTANFPQIVGRIIRTLTGGAGTIALLMFIYGGFQWLTAAGNPEKIKKGKDILLWSTIGVVVMFSSYLIARYLIEALTTVVR